ncbi:MAG: type IV toxin-antitoxin system AbiEi family antitoxin domain-containing protein, partial [Pseudonocardiaceae bacterium]
MSRGERGSFFRNSDHGQPWETAGYLYIMEELDWYLRRQSGVISCAQARMAGLSQDMVDRRIDSRRWERLHPGVYLSADHP